MKEETQEFFEKVMSKKYLLEDVDFYDYSMYNNKHIYLSFTGMINQITRDKHNFTKIYEKNYKNYNKIIKLVEDFEKKSRIIAEENRQNDENNSWKKAVISNIIKG